MLAKNWVSKLVDHWNRLLLEVTKTSTTKLKANGNNKRKIFVSTQCELECILKTYLAALNFVLLCGGNGSSGDQSKENYQVIKMVCETKFGGLTQFVRQKSVCKDLQNKQRGKGCDIAHGIWLKLNEKLGGTNWKVDVPLPDSPVPIMIVGCSFTHSPPGEQKPTMVGFSATTKPGTHPAFLVMIHESSSI